MTTGDFPSPLQVGLWSLETADLISVVVPVFNEELTIVSVLRELACVPAVGQIVVVNDASRDDTERRLQELSSQLQDDFWQPRLPAGMLLLAHATNQGKGAALQTGFRRAHLSWVGIQDADSEYNPQDLMRLLTVARCQQANVIYGSRFGLPSATSPLWHRAGNGAITALANACFRLQLTDVETCYKLVENQRLQAIVPTLKEGRFGIEIELTAKLARSPGVRFAECPIGYDRRTYAQGKKIGLRDAFRAVWCMGRYGWRD
jgi:glycosyltransferase involved in cell wall biosynthesis